MPKFPKKEIYVTQTFKLIFTKIDFCGTGIAQKGNDRHTRNHVIFAIIITFEVKITTFEVK